MENLTLTIIFLCIGIALFVVEMFTPGLGVSGLIGTVSLFVAVLLQIGNPMGIVFMVALALFIIAVALLLFLYLVSRGKFDKSKIVLNDNIEGSSTNLKEESQQAYTGQKGKTITPLRPSGKAEFEGGMLDVSTDGEFLPAGTQVKVTKVEGLRILVQAAED